MNKTMGYVVICLLFLSFIGLKVHENNDALKLCLVFMGAIAPITLWISMFANIMRNTSLSHRTTWIIALLLFNWVAAIVYFFVVFNRKTDK